MFLLKVPRLCISLTRNSLRMTLAKNCGISRSGGIAMKTTYLGVLVVLLLGCAGQAMAMYNPKTGRFLSRDPRGELGFEAMQRASGVATPNTGTLLNRQNVASGRTDEGRILQRTGQPASGAITVWKYPEHRVGFEMLDPSANMQNRVPNQAAMNLNVFCSNDSIDRIDPLGLKDVATKVEQCWFLFRKDPTAISHTYLRVEGASCGFYLKKFYDDGDWIPPWGPGKLVCPDSGGECVSHHVDDCEIDVPCFEKCVKDFLKPADPSGTYNFFTYNCGSWTRDVISGCKMSCKK